ncbi:MAG: hypothetical protein IPG39_12700 [Bacteroidetes bacterium]|nr:hypothetical protein [Bacteroidota bacterium]
MRKIPFSDTQGNISDENGNLLMSSNGYFIADATGDTMLNGANINPGMCTEDYGTPFGLPMPYANIILPILGDTTKYVLIIRYVIAIIRHSCLKPFYYSIIDMT